jgi:hypothetical protein
MLQDNRWQYPYMRFGERRPNPWLLWLIVTVLWTSATAIAIHDGWPQIHGGENALESWLVWLCLLLPPFIFAVIIAAAYSLTSRAPPRR